MIRFRELRNQIKLELLQKKAELDLNWDPYIAAWLAYAFYNEGVKDSLVLSEIVQSLSTWSENEHVWEQKRNLGPLSMIIYLTEHVSEELIENLSSQVENIYPNNKFSILRDPEIVYFLALGVGKHKDKCGKTIKHLYDITEKQMSGPLKRRILYCAVLKELDTEVKPELKEPQDPSDLISLVWWAERYDDTLDRVKLWEQIDAVKDQLAFSASEAVEFQTILSVGELCLLYEAVNKEIVHPDPNILFNFYPIHPRVRQIAEKHFQNKSYVTAVQQAANVLNEFIQQKTGLINKSEVELVQSTMKNISNPSKLKIRFNEFLNEDSGKNEQSGLELIAEGVFKAFRNPKGHKPEDHPLVQIDAYEALDQLIVISYLMKRVENAK